MRKCFAINPLNAVYEKVASVPYNGNRLFSSICNNLTGGSSPSATKCIRVIIREAICRFRGWFFSFDDFLSAGHYIWAKKMEQEGVWGETWKILAFAFETGCKDFVKRSYSGWILYCGLSEVGPTLFPTLSNDHYQPINGILAQPLLDPYQMIKRPDNPSHEIPGKIDIYARKSNHESSSSIAFF